MLRGALRDVCGERRRGGVRNRRRGDRRRDPHVGAGRAIIGVEDSAGIGAMCGVWGGAGCVVGGGRFPLARGTAQCAPYSAT